MYVVIVVSYLSVILQMSSGWFQEVESPAPGEAALVLGEQADVLQEHQGYRAGALQRSGGTPVRDTMEPERCLHLYQGH